jgi:uncharacterized membrane protein YgdD (TMEM256/DUF423 family)
MSVYLSCGCTNLKDSALARFILFFGAVLGGLAVALSAVAAHALPDRLTPKALAAVQSGIQMQGWHALALVVTALWLMRAGPGAYLFAQLAACAFVLGIVLFSGSIYAGELAGIRIGPTAPAGGILLMLGWLLLAISALRAGPTL